MKKLIFSILMCLTATSALAFSNPLKASYGKWIGVEDRVISVSPKGLDDVVRRSKETCNGNGKGGRIFKSQVISSITGKQILKIYNMSESYIGSIPFKKLVDKNKTYQTIKPVTARCADGAEQFILISPDKALYMISGPEDTFYLLHKRR